MENTMGLTGSSAEVISVTVPDRDEPDYDQPVDGHELVQALEDRTRRLAEDERVDDDIHPRNSFGI
jgi:hypothetical protein